MVRRLLFAAIVLHAVSIDASDRVRYAARIVRLRNEEERMEWCGAHKRIEACTRFVAPELVAIPVAKDGAWRIKADAHFIALIALQDMSRYGHEMLHVGDMESALESYVLELERVSFPDREGCERARAEAVQAFESRVRSFAEASNNWRDGAPHPDR